MLAAALHIIRNFLDEEYPDTLFNFYSFEDPINTNDIVHYYYIHHNNKCKWVEVYDNTDLVNPLFDRGIYYKILNLDNSKILSDQLDLLGLSRFR